MSDLSPRTQKLLRDFEEFGVAYDDKLTVYMEGLFYASVCTSLDDDRADAAMAAVIALTVALCSDPDCDPASYKTCTKCTELIEAAFPRCDDPNCEACREGE